ncbi:MAG: ABC transporter ATP-binding protein [Desulfobacterales bacterium]|nr:ABC transporter ATP-binding protein [Desulfobacterales bacterium]
MAVAIKLNNITVEFKKPTLGNHTLKNNIYYFITGKKISTFKAIDQLSLIINEKETIGIIGSNGAGKTTLLRIIAQIIVPKSGSVKIFKRVIPLLELGIGFHPELSGRENCYLAGALLDFTPKEIDLRLNRIIDFSGIHSFIDAPVKTYSSGMFARLAFSLATEVDPEIFLVDEIISVGDESFQRKCILRIQKMIKKGITTIFVSHNLDFLVTQCSRLIWIEHGKIMMDGAAVEVAHRYRYQQRLLN